MKTNLKIIDAVCESKIDLNFVDQNEKIMNIMDIFQDIHLQTLEDIMDNNYTNHTIDKVMCLQISFINKVRIDDNNNIKNNKKKNSGRKNDY